MIQVIARVFAILEEFSLDGEVSLSTLARITGLNKGTICNILRTLIELGYIRRTRESHYMLTPQFCELARPETIPAAELAMMRRTVASLAEKTQESGVLSSLRGHRVAVVAQAQHERSLMVNTLKIYAALSLYHSVSGRVLVSYLTPVRRAELCRQAGFPGEEWDGITTPEMLERACRKIRRDKLSVMKNPRLEIIAFAVPVFRPSGEVMSLGLTMPLMRYSPAERRRILDILRESSLELSGTVPDGRKTGKAV